MQKISTKVFIRASIIFGILGILLVAFGGPDDNATINQILIRLIWVCIFVILPSFALSIASKYLADK